MWRRDNPLHAIAGDAVTNGPGKRNTRAELEDGTEFAWQIIA
jgi:hypothetical protein